QIVLMIYLKKYVSFLALMMVPFFVKAQEMGLDERIDKAFEPVANWWVNLVLTPLSIGGKSIPFVVALLVVGALFFTVYFAFINFRRLPLAIGVVRGKYDYLESGVEKNVEVNV